MSHDLKTQNKYSAIASLFQWLILFRSFDHVELWPLILCRCIWIPSEIVDLDINTWIQYHKTMKIGESTKFGPPPHSAMDFLCSKSCCLIPYWPFAFLEETSLWPCICIVPILYWISNLDSVLLNTKQNGLKRVDVPKLFSLHINYWDQLPLSAYQKAKDQARHAANVW